MTNKTTLLLLSLSAANFAMAATQGEKPNLLIIHTDEQNFRTLSCYQQIMSEDQAFVWGKGNNTETPYIDRIAAEGVICSRYYAATPVSTPSRAAMVTGCYPYTVGAAVNEMTMNEDAPTFAKILRDNGYATSYLGKWHLEGNSIPHKFNVKDNAGFTDNRYMMTRGHSPYFYLNEDGTVAKVFGESQFEDYPEDKIIHATDFFTNHALEILERDKDKPFCMMISIPDPHTPDYARPPYHDMYNHMQPTMPMTMEDEWAEKRPKWAGSLERNEAQEFDAAPLLQYFGMVKHIDDCVGKLLKFLDDNNLTDNTIIIFTSDHGDLFYEHKRSNKGSAYEASARIPFVLRYPDKVKAGMVLNSAYVNTDFTPTILSLMGIKTDAKFHGDDTSKDFLKGDSKSSLNRISQFAAHDDTWASAVDDRYKLVLSTTDEPWLLDIEADPNEVYNYYYDVKYTKIAAKMQAELLNQLEQVGSPLVTNPNKPLILK
ncbi:MAG: sulfatase-like hydrolase/transferase [Rikenellaceae bacterium]